MLKKSIGIGLLCLTGHTYANISVTTVNDVVADDKECSLREAVHYVNTYLTAQNNETDAQKKQREADAKKGYFGCGGESSTSTILLKQKENYIVNSELKLNSSMVIRTDTNEFSVNDSEKGTQNATIKTNGAYRIFNIDDQRSEISQLAVSLIELNLEGCGLTTICADRGGIIFNRESLSIEYSKIYNGYANEGGAIYNEGLITSSSVTSAGMLNLTSSIFEKNKAKTGAVIFMGQPLFSISKSIFKENEVLNNTGSLIYSEVAFDSATTSTTSFSRVSAITNSNFFKNKGYLANVRDGVYINNVTAVDNSLGFYFHAPTGKAHISNSILVGNKNGNCGYAANDQSISLNNLVGSDCKAGEIGNLNTYIGNQKLFAGTSSENDKCDRPPADGLLCPFTTPENQFLGYFKPRLLSVYKTLSDSPIVNKGRLYSDGSNEGLASCEGVDIRGLSRSGSVHCDLGAIELIINSESVSRVGKDIKYGQIAKLNIINSIGDGELLPATECEGVLGSKLSPQGKPWQVGCLRIEQNAVTATSKGTSILDEHGEVVYTPNSNYHGLDDFNLRVITTTSRFSESERERDIVVPVRVVQSPDTVFENKTVNISGGAIGGMGVIGLIVLGLYRRKFKI